MYDKLYRVGLLVMIFGGILLLGRGTFAGLSTLVGDLSLLVVLLGLVLGLLGVASTPSASID